MTAYVFGARFRAGGFPIGVHDVHMNQGNSGPYAHDNGPYQDGGLVLTSRHSSTAVGIFLAFQGQSFNTDDNGHPIAGQAQGGRIGLGRKSPTGGAKQCPPAGPPP